ncbi:MAG: hypothetical protein HY893_03575 [Deltaproteobacteria bacterium]|nr:hypothetical protein [Deltaproteobacteria bacterium]
MKSGRLGRSGGEQLEEGVMVEVRKVIECSTLYVNLEVYVRLTGFAT